MNGIISTAISGLNAASTQLSVSASNIANASSTGSLSDDQNAPYSALTVTQTTQVDGSVQTQVSEKKPAFIPSFSPDSPFADDDGFIGMPNVNLAEELVLSQSAEHAYKANAQLIRVADELQEELIRAIDDSI